MKALLWLPILSLISACALYPAVADSKTHEIDDRVPARGVVKSCGGCRLNRLPEVKQFIFEDVAKYDGVVFEQIPGHNPDLFLYNSADQEIERIDLSPFDRAQCNSLLKEKGFRLKVENEL